MPATDVLVLQTMRSHDQWNTTIYSDDRYRGVRNLRTLDLMNSDDTRTRGIEQGDLVRAVLRSTLEQLLSRQVARPDLPTAS